MTDNVSTARNFVETFGVGGPPTLVDTRFEVVRHYQVFNTPTWILFDSSGKQLARGSRVDGSLEQALDSVT